MKLTLILAALLTIGSLAGADPATVLPEKLPAKLPAKASKTLPEKLPAKKVVAHKTVVKKTKASSSKKMATALPAFKGKKHLVVTSSNLRSSDEAQTGVVVRSMSTAEYAKYAARMAEEEKQNSATTQVIRVKRASTVASPQPVETLQVTAAEQDNTPDVGEAPRPRIVEAPVAEPRIEVTPIAKVVELPAKAAPISVPVAVEPTPAPVPVVVSAPVAVVVVPPTLTPTPVQALVQAPVAELAVEPVKEQRTISPTVPFVITMPTPASNPPPNLPPVAAAKTAEPQLPVPARPQTEAVYESEANAIRDEKQNSFNDRISISTAYLAAHYSQIEGQLEDGATSIGLGYAHDFGVIEGRAALEFVHGLDQSVSPGNARMIMLRGDAAYFFSKGTISPFVSGGLALAKVNVQSYRLQNDGTTVLRDHDSTTALGITPAAGVRFRITKRFDLELKVEELAFLVGSDASALGGLSAGGAVGFSF